MDGKKQRQALTAAERALQALARRDVDAAVSAARKAADLDQIGLYGDLPEAIAAVADDPDTGFTRLRDVVGPGPLAPLVDAAEGAWR